MQMHKKDKTDHMELFKEIYRLYPTADPEDYYKQGAWRNDVMKTDLLLLEAHRREAGAPDVPDLDDIKVPAPQNPFAEVPAFMHVAKAEAASPTADKPAGAVPQVFAGAAAAAANSTPVVEIRLIALFVAKWKLDPATAKTALAKLTAPHRRFIIQNFKTTQTGMEATKDLENFITECEVTKEWDQETPAGAPAAAATTAPTPAATAAAAEKKEDVSVEASEQGSHMIAAAKAMIRPQGVKPGSLLTGAAGVKRPAPDMAANPAWAQNKRPAFGAGMARPPAWGYGNW